MVILMVFMRFFVYFSAKIRVFNGILRDFYGFIRKNYKFYNEEITSPNLQNIFYGGKNHE